MSKDSAFHFIPELIGDYAHVIELSADPKRLYIETAVRTLHSVADVFEAFGEYRITRRKRDTEKTLKEEYEKLIEDRYENYSEEILRKIDVDYECLKDKINKGNFRNKEIRKFIKCLQDELLKAVNIFNTIKEDPDYRDWAKVEEVIRKAWHDYNKLLTIYIEEDEDNGKS